MGSVFTAWRSRAIVGWWHDHPGMIAWELSATKVVRCSGDPDYIRPMEADIPFVYLLEVWRQTMIMITSGRSRVAVPIELLKLKRRLKIYSSC